MRHFLLPCALILALGGCQPAPTAASVSTTPRLEGSRLESRIGVLGRQTGGGTLGVGLMNLESGETWALNGDRRFPLQSVFKLPLGAAVLAEVDAGRLSLDEVVSLTDQDLSPPHSPIAEAYPAQRDYTIAELLTAAVGNSDNTAADVLMKRIDGPGAVTAWLRSKQIVEVRIDRYERQLQPESIGMASFRPAWTGAAFAQAAATIPADQRRAAVLAYLKDPQDTATPRGMLNLLQQLNEGTLLSPASTRRLRTILTETGSGPRRIRAGLPKGASLAHKTGTGATEQGLNTATNDVGIVTLADGRRYALVVFLSGSSLDEAGREALVAEVARAAMAGIG